MAGIEGVFLDPAHPAPIGAVEPGPGRRGGILVGSREGGPPPSDLYGPPAAGGCDRPWRRRTLPGDLVEPALDGGVAIGGEEGHAPGLVDSLQGIDGPVTPCHLAEEPTVRPMEVEVLPARPLGGPEEGPVLQRTEVVRELHPVGARLGKQYPRAAISGVYRQQVQPLLVPGLALDVKSPAVSRPVHPGQVDVGVRPEVHADGRAAGKAGDEQRDPGVGTPGPGISLGHNHRPGRIHIEPLDHIHAGQIGPGQGDPGLVRAPPVAGLAVHLFLGDELGSCPALKLGAILGQGPGVPAGGWRNPEIIPADEGDKATPGRDAGVDFVLRRVRQTTQGAVAPGPEPEVALHRGQDEPAFVVPVVGHDARGLDTLALAPALLGLGQNPLARDQGGGVDQAPGGPARDFGGPEVRHPGIVRPGAEVGHQGPVRGQGDPARPRTAQVRGRIDPLQGQVGGGRASGRQGQGHHTCNELHSVISGRRDHGRLSRPRAGPGRQMSGEGSRPSSLSRGSA